MKHILGLCVLSLFLYHQGSALRYFPKFWSDQKCKKTNWSELNVGGDQWEDLGHLGLFLDEMNPDGDLKNVVIDRRRKRSLPSANRRMWYGVNSQNEDNPLSAICNIMEANDAFQWCTCIILDKDYVLTARNCFKDRPHDAHPKKDIPHIKITYGSGNQRTHPHKRSVTEMYFHPNPNMDAAILKLDKSIYFNHGLVPFGPDLWVYTTAWKNILPKCSTFTCGYGTTDFGDKDVLQCIYYGFTTNVITLRRTGLSFEDRYLNFTRAWLTSVNDFPDKYARWNEKSSNVPGEYSSACIGDAGSPLMYYQKGAGNGVFLIGMTTQPRDPNKCGLFGVDMAISMLSLVTWLERFLTNIPNPLLRNKYLNPDLDFENY